MKLLQPGNGDVIIMKISLVYPKHRVKSSFGSLLFGQPYIHQIFSSSELKAHKVSLKYTHRAVVRPCVRGSVHASTLSNMNISETRRPIAIKFYLKHHLDGGMAV